VVAVECGYSIPGLITVISRNRHPQQSLTSAIRVYVAAYFYGAAPHQVLVDPTSKFAVRDGTRNLDRSLHQARRAMKDLDDASEIDARYGTPRPRAHLRPNATRRP
jgi:hypothetical protein